LRKVRTPLNAIVNYLEMALENPIDDSTRELLMKAQKASRSLVYVIDDLLNLTKAEDGRVYASTKETFDLGATGMSPDQIINVFANILQLPKSLLHLGKKLYARVLI